VSVEGQNSLSNQVAFYWSARQICICVTNSDMTEIFVGNFFGLPVMKIPCGNSISNNGKCDQTLFHFKNLSCILSFHGC